ncbi:hypothetical protein AXX17_AT3G41030 [Arabidopsis thaliana]|uniref:Uncharacterized protein n=1 Tax=Arabidopsis thaliana TaxID=3702 RepID=A0A178VM58_ARATH|nr:hypothetical protein AXX17_AT3G41030 [Arabidopsis thaliana]
MKLTGVISPSIGNLYFLTSLSLTYNSSNGSIPLEVGKLFRLQHLNLSKIILGGNFPASLGNLTAISKEAIRLPSLPSLLFCFCPSELLGRITASTFAQAIGSRLKCFFGFLYKVCKQ